MGFPAENKIPRRHLYIYIYTQILKTDLNICLIDFDAKDDIACGGDLCSVLQHIIFHAPTVKFAIMLVCDKGRLLVL